MNSGTQGLTPEQQAQQQLAGEQMSTYWKLQAPAMGAVLSDINQNQSGRETRAMGESAGSVFAGTGDALNKANTTLADRGSGPGGGNFASKFGGIQTGGALVAGDAAAGARIGARNNQIQEVQDISKVGQGLVNRANTALDTAARSSADIAAQRAASRAQSQQEVASAATLAAMLL